MEVSGRLSGMTGTVSRTGGGVDELVADIVKKTERGRRRR